MTALAFSADGSRLAVGSTRGSTVWPLGGPDFRLLPGARPLAVPTGDGVVDLAFAGDRLLVADGDVRVWDLTGADGPRPLARLAGAGVSLAVSPAGDGFATQRSFLRPDGTADAEVTFWVLSGSGVPEQRHVVRIPIGMGGNDRGLAWLPDGGALYATTSDGGADLVEAR